jgi:diaminopimelate epimerase
MDVPFIKMHGLGNDFVVLDERATTYGLDAGQLARIADRRFGIGCDQILVVSPSALPAAAARYGIFNADGSAAEHCGNGVRCVARFLRDEGGVDGDTLLIEIGGELYDLAFTDDDDVRVNMGTPIFEPARIPITAATLAARYSITIAGQAHEFGCVSMGNPHAVMLVDDVEHAPVAEIGAALQHHGFFPARVNVGFLQIERRDRFRLRVFERGVGETLACGTGACAAMAVARRWDLLGDSARAALRGGELELEWSGDDHEPLYMTGPAAHVFEGIIHL